MRGTAPAFDCRSDDSRSDLEPAFFDLPSLFRSGGALFSPAERVVAAAHRFVAAPACAASFARGAEYRSVNPEIAIAVATQCKCALFAGDVLHSAGFTVPTEASRYAPPEDWPRQTRLIDRVHALDQLRAGDLLIVQHGDSSHLEVVTVVRGRGKRWRVTTAGARDGGLVEDETLGRKLTLARPVGAHFSYPGSERVAACRFSLLRPNAGARSGR
jgi:hypothetical protein